MTVRHRVCAGTSGKDRMGRMDAPDGPRLPPKNLRQQANSRWSSSDVGDPARTNVVDRGSAKRHRRHHESSPRRDRVLENLYHLHRFAGKPSKGVPSAVDQKSISAPDSKLLKSGPEHLRVEAVKQTGVRILG